MDARSLVMGYAAARTVTDDPQTLNQAAILGAVVDGRPIVSFVIAQQYARSLTPPPAQNALPTSASAAAPPLAPASTGKTVMVPTIEKHTKLAKVQEPLLKKRVRVEAVPVYEAAGGYKPDDIVRLTPPSGTKVHHGDKVTVEVWEDRRHRAAKQGAAGKDKAAAS